MMKQDNEVVAIIRNPIIGVGDGTKACLSFETFVDEGLAASHWVSWDEAKKIIEDAGVTDIKQLDGTACWVIHENNTQKFQRVWKK